MFGKSRIGSQCRLDAFTLANIQIALRLHFPFTQGTVSLLVTELNDHEMQHFVCVLHDVTTDKPRLEDLRQTHRIEAIDHVTGDITHGLPDRLTMIFASLETMSFKDENKYQAAMADPAAEAVRLGPIAQRNCCRSAGASL